MEERLREIGTYSLCDKDISKEDKAFIRETSKALGVKFDLRKCPTCKNKYSDQVHLLIRKIHEMQSEFPEGQTITASKCKYKLRPELKINVIHRGVYHINADTLTDELAEILINDGYSRWFENNGVPSYVEGGLIPGESHMEDIPHDDFMTKKQWDEIVSLNKK